MSEPEDFQPGGACPDCGSHRTRLYPLGEGVFTLYCDNCKREEPVAGRYEWGHHGSDPECPHVARVLPDGTRDELFDVRLYSEDMGNENDPAFVESKAALDTLIDTANRDRAALDRLNLLLSAKEWPGPSGLEDVCEIVRATGRAEVPDAPPWERH